MKFWKARMLTYKSFAVFWQICISGHLAFIIPTFGYSLCRLWALLVYTTYLDNYIVPACFSPLVLTLILVSCTVFMAFQWFSSIFFSSVIHLACVCIDYLHLWYMVYLLICNICLLVDFKFSFA